jgi:hypothetical protein
MAKAKKVKSPEPPRIRLVLLRGPVVNWMCGDLRDTSPAFAIGITGLFVATPEPVAVESPVSLGFEIPGEELRARGTVRAVVPGRGFTVEFLPMPNEQRANLQGLMKYLPAYSEETVPAPPPAPEESARAKRRYPRITLAQGLRVAWQVDGRREVGMASTIGYGGLFIAAKEVPAAGTTVRLLFDAAGGVILTNATVRDARPGVGMGVEFSPLDADSSQRLTDLLAQVLLGGPSAEKPGAAGQKPAEEEAAAKRRFKRVDLPRGLIVAWSWEKQSEMSIAPTVGRGGLFIATLDPAPNGTPLRMLFEVPGGEILATGVVRDCRPGRGMGVEFTQMGAQEIARLESLLHKLLA